LAVFGKPRYLGLVEMTDSPTPNTGQWIVIKTVRGLEMGLLGGVLSQDQEAKYRASCLAEPGEEQTRGPEPMLQEVEFMEPASEAQVQAYCLCRSDEETILVRARQLLKAHQLQMKLVDVEYTIDRRKLFFYFTSEQRIDFRAYVRDLAREFRIRIEMRQIGVRDEARTVRGIAPCGRPCCCSYWLHRFTPINIRMVKEQNLALNPTKISGICGRLMCCMAYEHFTYNNLWKSLPSPGSKIKTTQGNFVLEGVDLQSETVLVRFPEGREVPIAIVEFSNFRDIVLSGGTWEKDVAEEPVRRPLLSQPPVASRRAQPLSTKQNSSVNFGDDAAKNRKSKPEKISIEKHIAERTGEQPPVPAGSAEAGGRPAGKRGRRRKNKNPSGAAAAEPQRMTGQPANRTEAAQPLSRKGQQPVRKNRPRSQEGRPHRAAGGERKGDGEKHGAPGRRSSAGLNSASNDLKPHDMNGENV
jgi:cell fate regulator YaaT (PSP1 superfamily)